MSGNLTDYGFNWGPMTVTRIANDERKFYALSINTNHRELMITVSPGGRKIHCVETKSRRKRAVPSSTAQREVKP